MIRTRKKSHHKFHEKWNTQLAEYLVKGIQSIQLGWTTQMNKYWLKLSLNQQKMILISLCGLSLTYAVFLLIGFIKLPISIQKSENEKSSRLYLKSDSLILLEKIYQSPKKP